MMRGGAFLLLLAVVALLGAGAASPVTPFSVRFRAQQSERAGVAAGETLTNVLKNVFAEDDVTEWSKTEGFKALKAMFDADASPVVGAVHATGHKVDASQKEFIDKLLVSFPKASRKAYPKVQVRGAGPTGLSAALYAIQSSQTVHVLETRTRYYRTHVVSTWATKSFPAPPHSDVKPDGMENLFDLLGAGIGDRAKSTGQAWDTVASRKPIEGGTPGHMIRISDLEKMLRLTAMVVGVTFNVPGSLTTPKNAARALERNKVTSLANAKAGSPWALSVCAAKDEADTAMPSEDAYDVLVGAEGTGSPTRKHYLGASFVTPKVYTSTNPLDGGEITDISAKIISGGGLVTAGFVADGDPTELCSGSKQRKDLVGAPDGFGKKPYFKKFTTGCQVEAFFTQKAGAILKRAFGTGCNGGNNLLSGTAVKDTTDLKHLKLLRVVLEAAFTSDVAAKKFFDNVVEFKLWENTLRMSVATTDTGKDEPSALVAKIRDNKQLVAIIGDAARDALPDGGMGVNDGHHQAAKLGEAIKALSATNPHNEARDDKVVMEAYVKAANAHETVVVRALHAKLGNRGIAIGTGDAKKITALLTADEADSTATTITAA